MDREFRNYIAFWIVACCVISAGTMIAKAETCERQWARSGMKAEWYVLGGCIVQRKDGTWVPADAIRDVAP